MKQSINLWDLLGWVAVVAMLVLASPGVTLVHAEAEEQAARAMPAPGPACQADAEAHRSFSVDISDLVAMQTTDGGTGVVTLGTGGYGYGERSPAGLVDDSGRSAYSPAD
jgi:hypothetical protein